MIEPSPIPRPTDPATKASDADQDRLVGENRELRRRLAELELERRTDPLTGLLNRRAADEAFAREAARAVREPASLCIALIDVDDFKAFNDAHGHLAGDELLCESAERWRTALRTEDMLARVGGDEFAVMLPACSAFEAKAILARLAATMRSSQSVSWGVAAWRTGEPPENTWARADRALYENKARRGPDCSRCDVMVLGAYRGLFALCPNCRAPLQSLRGRQPAPTSREPLWRGPAGTPRAA